MPNRKMRFLVQYIDPKTGRERLGAGPTGGSFQEYATLQNVIRFGLAKPGYPPGQYNIYTAPRGATEYKFLATAYKRV